MANINPTLKEELEELESLGAMDEEYLDLIKSWYATAKMEKIENDDGYELIIYWYNPDTNDTEQWTHTEKVQKSKWIYIDNPFAKELSQNSPYRTGITWVSPNTSSTYTYTYTNTTDPYTITQINPQSNTYTASKTTSYGNSCEINYNDLNTTVNSSDTICINTLNEYENKIKTLEDKVNSLMEAIND